jgi:hypothetical protein
MSELVNFGHSPLLEAMPTFSTWKGSFSAADKQAMADALQTIRTAIVQPVGANSNAKRRSAKCVTDAKYDIAVITVLCAAMCLRLSGKLDEIEAEED